MIELENATEPSNEDKITILMSKIKLLGQEYIGSPHCFPVGNYISYISDYFFVEILCQYTYFLIFSFRFFSKTIGNKGV